MFRWKQGIEKYSRARRNISLICSNHENGIGFFSRGEVAVSYRSENLPPPFDLRRFMENSSPLFRPVSVNNPPMMYLSANFRWKFHRNFYPISSKRPYLPLSPPLSLRIHLCTRIPIRCSFDVAVSSIICSQRVNLSRVKWKGDTREGGWDPLLPLGIRNRRMTMMVEPPGYEFYFFYVSFLPLK